MRKLIALVCLSCAACESLSSLPPTPGETASGFGYVPLDPVPVTLLEGCTSPLVHERLPYAFPDNTVRIAYKTIHADGKISLGPIASTQRGENYQIIIDFINSDVVNKPFHIKPYQSVGGKAFEEADQLDVSLKAQQSDTKTTYLVSTQRQGKIYVEECEAKLGPNDDRGVCKVTTPLVNIPLYVGVGLRITADLVAVRGKTDLTGLGSIVSAVENGYVSGSMVVQTLGINGKAITGAMPIQSDLNQTTIQNAIVSIGAIKALMYEDETNLKARVVGLHDPIGGGQPLVNALVSAIASEPPEWEPRCIAPDLQP